MSNGNTGFAYGLLMFSLATMILLSMFLPMYQINTENENRSSIVNDIENQYMDFTGSKPASESVWVLTGIYTPYGQNKDGGTSSTWGFTDDGWLYGTKIVDYTPSQYDGVNAASYAVLYDSDDNVYKYTTASTTVNQHEQDTVYAGVVMDIDHKSNIFFTSAGKVTQEDGRFYYTFSGYRYAFQPVQKHQVEDDNGNVIDVIPNTTSLSLIWYDYYGNSGISGQLIISGSDGGVAYLTAAEIVSAFNNDTSTSKFNMTFNGVDVILAIRLDPYYLTNGMSVEECYENGFWSIMVSSKSVDASSYVAADYEFNPAKIFDVMIDILTFNTREYGLTGIGGILATLVVVVPVFLALIVIGLDNYKVIILAGIYLLLTSITWDFSLFG